MKKHAWTFCLLALAFTLALAALSPLASSRPDGLEKIAADHGRAEAASESPPTAPMADYEVPGVRNASLRTILAGLAGTLAVFGAMLALGKLIAARPKSAPPEGAVGETPPPR
jgi:cobalt/nickel transport protein